MGNNQGRGIGVLNHSSINEINVGLSMGPTHYFENGIKHGEIFYRRPGAVHYTVYAFARQPETRNDITNGQVADAKTLGAFIYGDERDLHMNEMLSSDAYYTIPCANTSEAPSVKGSTGAAAGASAYPSPSVAKKSLGRALERSNLFCEKKGCYGGRPGSWLVVEGGPYMDEKGVWNERDLTIREATKDQLFLVGKFTESSHGVFNPNGDFQCTKNCDYCKRK